MPSVRTEITEIVTGLAMLGYQSINRALEVRPRHISHVTDDVFDRLEAARAERTHDPEFEAAWQNGLAFARSERGLRGRPPWSLEWKGHQKPASRSIETIPADLRIDHVYLISCKYRSRILHNARPATLFEHCLAPTGPAHRHDWFEHVSPDAFEQIWGPIHGAAGISASTPPSGTSKAQRQAIKTYLAANAVDIDSVHYYEFVRDVSEQSARRWRSNLGRSEQRNELLWRLLRMQAAPYFVLGAGQDGAPVRYQVATPWDFSQRHTLDCLEIRPGQRRQPSVDWTAHISSGNQSTTVVDGHVEIRWSHGKLTGAPEAKVYLDTNPLEVPGYFSIDVPSEHSQ